jgi:uncharacterized membrane protein
LGAGEESIIRVYAEGIAKGYLRLVKSIGAVLSAILLVAGLSLLIVTPLWFFATKHTTAYTVVSICGLAVAALTPLVFRLIKEPQLRKRFFLRIARAAIYLCLAGLLYLVVLFYVWGNFAAAVPLTVVHVTATGLVLYGKRSGKKK